jgi:hypothetical protein
MESLTKLKQTGSMEGYKTQFETLADKVYGLSVAHKLNCILGGLKDNIRLPIRMFNPRNLINAYGLAKIQEEYVLNSRSAKGLWGSAPDNNHEIVDVPEEQEPAQQQGGAIEELDTVSATGQIIESHTWISEEAEDKQIQKAKGASGTQDSLPRKFKNKQEVREQVQNKKNSRNHYM